MPTPVAIAPVSDCKKSETEEEQEGYFSIPKVKAKTKNQLDIHFDPMNEIPTFSQYKIGKEVNEAMEHRNHLTTD